MRDAYQSAESIRHPQGLQYHINLAPGELAEYILLVGDPARAELAASMFAEIQLERRHREYVTFTGSYQGIRVSVMATGIGPGAMEIAVIELSQCVERPTFIRCGSCAALQEGIKLGDLIISQAAYRLENTSAHFVGDGYPAVSDPEVLLSLVQAADELGIPQHIGITATAPGFYGAQGRRIGSFLPRETNLVTDLQRQGVKNLEMEISTLFILAMLSGARSGAVCAVFGSRHDDSVIMPEEKDPIERRCVETGLRAFINLAALDGARGRRPRWHPGLVAAPSQTSRLRA